MSKPDPLLACEHVNRAIAEALGTGGLTEEMARHVLTCVACAREAESVERLAGGLRAIPLTEPSQAFWDTLSGRIIARVHTIERRHALALSALAAAALLLFTIIPAERVGWFPRSVGEWLPEVTMTDPWVDPLNGVRSAEEAARVVRRVAIAQDFGPRAIQRMVDVMEEEAVRRPETLAWNLLDTLGPQELERVLARLEKGVAQ